MAVFKTLLRVGLIGTVAAGAAVFIAGPERAGALVSQAHDRILRSIDDSIEDPVALRAQLRELEKQYPARIGQVRGDLAELREQMRQIEREAAIAERVVALAESDLGALKPLLAEAEAREVASSGEGLVRHVAAIRFDNRTYTLDQALTRANQISQTKVAYANRAADAQHDLVYLRQQEERLSEILMQLEAERSTFQAQLFQLDRQVDAISRNEKLIAMLEERQRTIEDVSRYEVANLDQMVARLAEVRARQQAELDALTGQARTLDYEDVARMEVSALEHLPEASPAQPDGVIEHSVFGQRQPKRR